MKTLLNLLPEEKKLALKRRVRSNFILWQIALLFFLEIFYASALIGILMILNYQLHTLNQGDEQQAGDEIAQKQMLREYEGKFRGANEAVEVIGKIAKEHLHFSHVFLLLEEFLPASVRIDRLATEDYTVRLTGRAETREGLLELQKRLQASSCLAEVNVPISNLFSQTDVDFQLDFQVKPQCLRGQL